MYITYIYLYELKIRLFRLKTKVKTELLIFFRFNPKNRINQNFGGKKKPNRNNVIRFSLAPVIQE